MENVIADVISWRDRGSPTLAIIRVVRAASTPPMSCGQPGIVRRHTGRSSQLGARARATNQCADCAPACNTGYVRLLTLALDSVYVYEGREISTLAYWLLGTYRETIIYNT